MSAAIEGHRLNVVRHQACATIELCLERIGVPSFSLDTLSALLAFGDALRKEAAGLHARPWRRIILTAKDPATFSMGGDIASIAALARDQDIEGAATVGEAVSQTLVALSSGFGLEIETVAVVDGRAFGFGFEVALACDRIVASPAATFGLPEGRFGLFAGMGAISLLPRRASKAVMERLVIDGQTIGAADCYRAGIVDQVVPSPRSAVLEEGAALTPDDWHRIRQQTIMRRRAKGYAYPEIREGLRIWEAAVLAMPRPDIETATRIALMQAKRSRSPSTSNTLSPSL